MNCLSSGKDITACSNSFLCNFDGKAKESDGGKCPLAPLAMPLIRDPGAYVSYIDIQFNACMSII